MEQPSFNDLLVSLRQAHEREVHEAANGRGEEVSPNLPAGSSLFLRVSSGTSDVDFDTQIKALDNRTETQSRGFNRRQSTRFASAFSSAASSRRVSMLPNQSAEEDPSASLETLSNAWLANSKKSGGTGSVRNVSLPGTSIEEKEGDGTLTKRMRTSMLTARSIFELRPEWSPGSKFDNLDGEDDVFALEVVAMSAVRRASIRRVMTFEGQVAAERSYVLGPQSAWRRYFEVVGFIALMYEGFWVPIEVAFKPPPFLATTIIEYMLAVFWTADILLIFNCGYISQTGYEVMDRQSIALRYLRTWFFIDLITVLPDWIFIFFEGMNGRQASGSIVQASSFLRSLRLLRLQKLSRILYVFEQRLNSGNILMLFHSCKIIFCLVYVIHALACMWYYVGTTSTESWIHSHSLVDSDSMFLYAQALFWSMTRFQGDSGIDPNTTFELFFCSFVGLGSLLGFSSFLSKVTNMMMGLSRMQEKQTNAARLLNEYLEKHSISVELSVRAKTCLNGRSTGSTESFGLDSIGLPKQMVADIKDEATRPLVIRHPLFLAIYKIHARAVRHICSDACVQKAFLPGEVVFVKDDPCDAMILQTSGRTVYSYLKAHDEVRKGEWFAEMCLWVVWVFRGDLKTTSATQTLEISVAGFLSTVNAFAPFFANGFFCRYAQVYMETMISTGVTSDRVDFAIQAGSYIQANRRSTASVMTTVPSIGSTFDGDDLY